MGNGQSAVRPRPRLRPAFMAAALILPTVIAVPGTGVVPAAVADTPVAATPPDSNAQFDQYCMSCHGPDGRGIAGLGVDLVESAFVAGRSQAELVEFLKAGRLPDDAASRTGRPMPGFAWVSDGELESIAGFLKARNTAK